jgi:hypothetical protein
VSRPFLNISGAASLLSTQARIYQTTTIGPAGLYCCLDYGGGEEGSQKLGMGSG